MSPFAVTGILTERTTGAMASQSAASFVELLARAAMHRHCGDADGLGAGAQALQR